MATPATWKGVIKHFKSMPEGVRRSFEDLPGLAEGYSWQVCLAYLFSRVEMTHHMLLYCGVVKLHRANSEVAKSVIQAQHFTRDNFQERFETVFGKAMPKPVHDKLKSGEKVRDRVMHGKTVSDATMRKAIVDVLDYASDLNSCLDGIAKFSPFSDLRGFKGRGESLPKATTRWLLKGMGFSA